MKRAIVIILSILIAAEWGLYPLLAQQVNPQIQQFGGYSQPGQTSISHGPTSQVPQGQTYYSQGARAPGAQPQSADLSQVSQRACGWAAVTQTPSSPSRSTLLTPPQTIPIQGISGASPGIAGAQVGLQHLPQSSLTKESLSAQGAGLNPVPVLFSEPLSTIEANYRTPAFAGEKPRELRQYGYSLFASPVSTFAPVEDVPVGPDYILGPGDDLAINVWGAMDSGVMRTVDRNGQIILPSVGPMRVWGLTFSQAERLIREQLARHYRGFQTTVTMGRLRTIRIYVVGEVCQPGSYTLSSLSTVTNALFSAGGPLKLGSLRNIEIKRNHHTVGTLDLYDFLLRGDKTRDFRLESGDTIFIPTIGPIAAISGEVKRPAIYELQGSTRVQDLIEMAGGLTPQSYLKRIQVIRAKPNAEREVIDLDLTSLQGNGNSPVNIEVRNGDLVKIYPADPRIYNTISLAGVVKYPGEYEIKPNMRLSQLLPRASLLPEAHMDRVEVIRFKEDLTTDVVHANLRKAWVGDPSEDILLRPRDLITVRTEFQGHKSITLAGEVKLPGTYNISPGERLSSVIKRAGGFTDKAFLPGAIFTRRSVQELEKKRLEEFLRQHEERLLSEERPPSFTPISLDEQHTRQARVAEKREQVKVVASKITLGRIVIHLDEMEKFEETPNNLLLEDGDTLNIPQRPATVLIAGSVRNPTAIVHRQGEDIQYYLNRAGGFSQSAEPKEMYLLKADGSALIGFLRLKNVDPGDAIIVPPRTQERYDWSWLKDIATIAGQAALGLAGLAAIF